MRNIVLKKVLQLGILFVGITFISFWVIHLAPGSPADVSAGMDPRVGAEAHEKLTRLYGLDRPVLERYASWFSKMARFDFGESFTDGEKVRTKILRTIPITLALNGASLFLTLLFGIPIGVFLAVRSGSLAEKTLSFVLLAVLALPGFWLALLLMSWLGVGLHLFPVSGLHSLFYEEMPPLARGLDMARHMALPVVVITLSGVAMFSRYVKEAMEEVLRQNYVRSARARGLPERAVLFRHALKNALLPVVTLLGLSIPGLLGGSVVLESVFSLPGMGRLFFSSVSSRDYPVIMGILVLGAFLTLLGNALADLAYAMADPRIRRESGWN